MADDNNDDVAATPAIEHDPPSLPASPHPKRSRNIEPEPSLPAAVVPSSVISASASTNAAPAGDESGTATPTPLQMSGSSHAAAHAPAAPAPESTTLHIELLSPTARAPTKGSPFAAGHDLYASADTVVPARKWALVPTDIKISVPAGTCASAPPPIPDSRFQLCFVPADGLPTQVNNQSVNQSS